MYGFFLLLIDVFLLTWKIKAVVLVCVPEENWELNDNFNFLIHLFYTWLKTIELQCLSWCMNDYWLAGHANLIPRMKYKY